MPWNDFLGGDQAASTDPLDILKSITGAAVPENAVMPVARVPNVPASAIPQKPLPVGPMVDAVQPHGTADWKALLEQIGPLIGSLALHEPGQRTGFLNGYMQGQQLGTAERDRKTAATQAEKQAAARFRLEVGQHALQIDDPIQRAQFVDLAESSGVTAGLLKSGDLASLRTVPEGQAATAQLKELSDQLTSLERNGYNVDELAQSGAHVRLKNGTDVPIQTAIALTRARPLGTDGTPIVKPPTTGKTAEERFVTKWAKDRGKTPDTLTAKEELDAKTEYANAGKTTPTSTGGVDAQFNDLVALWKQGHPGQEPPADVRVKLRRQANEVNDKATGTATPLTDDAVDYAATQFRVTGRMPALGMNNADARNAIVNRTAAQARALRQSPAQAIQKQAAYKADSGALDQMRKSSSSASAFETKALAQTQIIADLSAKVPRTQWPIINSALQAGRTTITGDENATKLANAIETFTEEYAKVMNGSTGSSAAASDSAREASKRLINTAMNAGTMAGVIELMKKEMHLTIDGYDATINDITERMGGAPAPRQATPPPPSTPGPSYEDYKRSRGIK